MTHHVEARYDEDDQIFLGDQLPGQLVDQSGRELRQDALDQGEFVRGRHVVVIVKEVVDQRLDELCVLPG